MLLQQTLFATLSALAFALPRVSQGQSAFTTLASRANEQNIVTWDKFSISVNGERLFILSAEFHPFRLPSPGLWLDVFQKLKALGYSAVSFYVYWPVLEGEPGSFRADGVFALDQFFQAAKQAGIYLIARPGPYINSESSGGGLPGWQQRNTAWLRSTDTGFLNSTDLYIKSIGKIISEAEITKGGPVILLQPENEYSICSQDPNCLDPQYQQAINDAFREAGITVPLINNDGIPLGNFKPGSGAGEVDIYGWDYYPLGWGGGTCANPSDWNRGASQPDHLRQVRGIDLQTSPRASMEYQGGFPDPWGGVGSDLCSALINHEFERVFFKMNYAMHLTVLNLYMTCGGTNWGNLGYPLGYTSYDVGAAIREDRAIVREKAAEMKLQANFHRASPAFLTAEDFGDSTGVYADNTAITISRVLGERTKFYIARHTDHKSFENTPYFLKVETSVGEITVPQLGGSLAINGRDSKIHVVDYDVGGINLIYSSAEVFSWKKSKHKTVLLLYGGGGETHEFALPAGLGAPTFSRGDSTIIAQQRGELQVVQWKVGQGGVIASFGKQLDVFMLWRNEAYQYWVLDLPAPEPINLYTSPSRLTSTGPNSSVIIKGGYLMRSASIVGSRLNLVGDVNATSDIEVVSAPEGITSLSFNGQEIETSTNNGRLKATIIYDEPAITLPDLTTVDWHYVDSLPEITAQYDDNAWRNCDLSTSNNPRPLTTPKSLYSSDYGYHAGSLLYRGHFVANGDESTFYIQSQGGAGYGHTIWLNSTYLGSVLGDGYQEEQDHTVAFPSSLTAGERYVITVLVDHMGYSMNFEVDQQTMKNPRGILAYNLAGHADADMSWKMTGNLGGEEYLDHFRGPLNEGSTFSERQGFHIPGAPLAQWIKRSPITEGIQSAGVGFFATTFSLDIPQGYDVPISITLNGPTSSTTSGNFRLQIYVNGWQFGKYVNHIGPQKAFPVPEGILNHRGENYLAITLWAQDGEGAKLESIGLSYDLVVQSGYSKPELVQGSPYALRENSY